MHVFSSQMDAVVKEDRLAASTSEGGELLVAKVLAWNSDRLDIPRQHGAKKHFSFIKVGLSLIAANPPNYPASSTCK